MNLSIKKLDEELNIEVLDRGLHLLESKAVGKVSEDEAGHYSATVKDGGESHDVSVHIQRGRLTEATCDCHGDPEVVCEHIAAVIFAIEEQKSKSAKPKSGAAKAKKPASGAKVPIAKVIDTIEKEALGEFVLEYARRDATFRKFFMARFAAGQGASPSENYRNQVAAMIKAARDRHGFIQTSQANKMARPMHTMLEKEVQNLSVESAPNAIGLSQAILDLIPEALTMSADPKEIVSSLLDEAPALLREVAKLEDLPEKTANEIFDYIIQATGKEPLSHSLAVNKLLSIAIYLTDTDKQEKAVLARFDDFLKNQYTNTLDTVELVEMFMEQRGKTDELYGYLRRHASNSYVRDYLIDQLLEKGDKEEARKVIAEGLKNSIRFDPWNKPWLEAQLSLAIESRDTHEIINAAKGLFLSHGNDPKYIRLMKENLSPKQWEAEFKKLENELTHHSYNYLSLGRLYQAEERWDKLMQLIENPLSAQLIKAFFAELHAHYPLRLAEAAVEAVLASLSASMFRTDYSLAQELLPLLYKSADPATWAAYEKKLRTHYGHHRKMKELLDSLR